VRRKRPPDGSEGQGEAKHRWKVLYVICGFSGLRSRLIFCVMSLMAQGAHRGGQSPPPPVPRAPASNIATAWCLRLIPAGCGSGRGSVRAKHGPQPASMRAAPAFRERLSDVEAASTGSFSGPMSGGDSHIGTGPRRPGKRSATRQNNGATGLPGRSSTLARQRCACAGLGEPTGGPRRLGMR
jgi:hypothetical protein